MSQSKQQTKVSTPRGRKRPARNKGTDMRRINMVWSEPDDAGQWNTYARAGSDCNDTAVVLHLHVGRHTPEDMQLISLRYAMIERRLSVGVKLNGAGGPATVNTAVSALAASAKAQLDRGANI